MHSQDWLDIFTWFSSTNFMYAEHCFVHLDSSFWCMTLCVVSFLSPPCKYNLVHELAHTISWNAIASYGRRRNPCSFGTWSSVTLHSRPARWTTAPAQCPPTRLSGLATATMGLSTAIPAARPGPKPPGAGRRPSGPGAARSESPAPRLVWITWTTTLPNFRISAGRRPATVVAGSSPNTPKRDRHSLACSALDSASVTHQAPRRPGQSWCTIQTARPGPRPPWLALPGSDHGHSID